MGINLGLILGMNIWECIRMKLGLILGVIDLGCIGVNLRLILDVLDLRVCWGANVGSILGVKIFGDVFGKKIETKFWD